MPAVALPGGGEHPLHPGLGRVRLAGEAEPGKEDNQNKEESSHDHRRRGRRQASRRRKNAPVFFRTLALIWAACKDNL